MEKLNGSSISALLIFILILGSSWSCASTPVVTHTPEEISAAQQAVIKVMEITTLAGAESFGTNWETSAIHIIPSDAGEILANIESIPGLRMQLEAYVGSIQSDTAQIVAQLPAFLVEEVFPSLSIEDPFSLIKGNSDAITRFFASQVSPLLEDWIAQQLNEEGLKGIKTWSELVRTYNMYTQAHNILNKNSNKPPAQLITADPVHVVTVTIIRHFLDVMRAQEALLRSMAPAYDDPLIALFSSR